MTDLDKLIAWLETKEPEAVYGYLDPCKCLAAQYNQHLGKKYTTPAILYEYQPGEPFEQTLERIALQDARTFGAALLRAKAVRANV